MSDLPVWLAMLWAGGVLFGIIWMGMFLEKVLARIEAQNQILADIRERLRKAHPDEPHPDDYYLM